VAKQDCQVYFRAIESELIRIPIRYKILTWLSISLWKVWGF